MTSLEQSTTVATATINNSISGFGFYNKLDWFNYYYYTISPVIGTGSIGTCCNLYCNSNSSSNSNIYQLIQLIRCSGRYNFGNNCLSSISSYIQQQQQSSSLLFILPTSHPNNQQQKQTHTLPPSSTEATTFILASSPSSSSSTRNNQEENMSTVISTNRQQLQQQQQQQHSLIVKTTDWTVSTIVAIAVSGFACVVIGAAFGSWITISTILSRPISNNQQQNILHPILKNHNSKRIHLVHIFRSLFGLRTDNTNDTTNTTSSTHTSTNSKTEFNTTTSNPNNNNNNNNNSSKEGTTTIDNTYQSRTARTVRDESSSAQFFNNMSSLSLSDTMSPAIHYAADCRRLLPKTIILIRHGESMANADPTIWKRAPDNLIGLTENGKKQALDVGTRVRTVLDKVLQTKLASTSASSIARQTKNKANESSGDSNGDASVCGGNTQSQEQQHDGHEQQHDQSLRVHLVVSPFERTQQTASILRTQFNEWIVRTDIESRIREQEVGNVQDNEFALYRTQQEQIGRFFYRFPTGESGADVFDRVKSWWYESILPVNLRIGYDPIDAIVVVTHGLTMRFILMQLFNWSPTTFHSVYNATNCEMYVLRKDLSKPGSSPYVLDTTNGDMPQSSINLYVTTKDGTGHTVQLTNYLNVPPPRTMQIQLIKRMLLSQYPELFSPTVDDASYNVQEGNEIDTITFLPFAKCDDEEILQPLRIPAGRRRIFNTENYSTIHYDSSGTTNSNDDDNNNNNNCNNDIYNLEAGYKVTSSLSDPPLLPSTINLLDNKKRKSKRLPLEQSHRFPYFSLSDNDDDDDAFGIDSTTAKTKHSKGTVSIASKTTSTGGGTDEKDKK